MNDLKELRRIFRKKYIRHVIIRVFSRAGHLSGMVDFFWGDLRNILIYDYKRQRKAQEYIPLPQIWSDDGEKVLNLFLSAYEESKPVADAAWESDMIEKNGWRCVCGHTNASYTSTCICGKNRREVPREEQKSVPQPISWKCSCGRDNPLYTYTCACGKQKRDVLLSESEKDQ